MNIERCSKADFDQILDAYAAFWGGNDLPRPLHHESLIFEFGDTAFVIKDGATIAAYLFGYLSQIEPVAYAHLVAVRDSHRRQGLGRRLYEHFVEVARQRGCRKLKATCGPWNRESIDFHTAFGMSALGEPNADGVPVMKDYRGPGVDRVIFVKEI